jgi:hypothetical protein
MRLFRRDTPAEPPAPEPPRAERIDAADAGINREVRMSPGGPAELLNVSETGLLVEGKTRLSTGAKVLVTLTGREAKRLHARVVRCQVCAIHRDGTMTYQTALALDEPAGLEEIAIENTAVAAPPELEAVAVAERFEQAVAAPEPAAIAFETVAALHELDVPPEVPVTPPADLPPDLPLVPLAETTAPANVLPRLVNQW